MLLFKRHFILLRKESRLLSHIDRLITKAYPRKRINKEVGIISSKEDIEKYKLSCISRIIRLLPQKNLTVIRALTEQMLIFPEVQDLALERIKSILMKNSIDNRTNAMDIFPLFASALWCERNEKKDPIIYILERWGLPDRDKKEKSLRRILAPVGIGAIPTPAHADTKFTMATHGGAIPCTGLR